MPMNAQHIGHAGFGRGKIHLSMREKAITMKQPMGINMPGAKNIKNILPLSNLVFVLYAAVLLFIPEQIKTAHKARSADPAEDHWLLSRGLKMLKQRNYPGEMKMLKMAIKYLGPLSKGLFRGEGAMLTEVLPETTPLPREAVLLGESIFLDVLKICSGFNHHSVRPLPPYNI